MVLASYLNQFKTGQARWGLRDKYLYFASLQCAHTLTKCVSSRDDVKTGYVAQGNEVVVSEIVPSFAAAKSNQFDVGDIVLSIDNVLVSNIPLSEVKNLTIGRVGTEVNLMMRSPTEVDTLHLLKTQTHFRAPVHTPRAPAAVLLDLLTQRSAGQGKDYRVKLVRQPPAIIDKQNEDCARVVYRST